MSGLSAGSGLWGAQQSGLSGAGIPSWVPTGAKSFYDFVNNRGYSNGSVRPSSTSDFSETRAAPSITYDLIASTQFAANVLRRTSVGLLIEPSSQNQLVQSQFGGITWGGNSNSTLTPNAATAPDGTTSAATFLASDTTTNIRGVNDSSFTATGSTAYSIELFVKTLGTNFYIQVNTPTGAFSAGIAYFDLTGITAVVGADLAAGLTSKSASIVQAANGFYRVSFSFTTPAGATGIQVYGGLCTVVSATGDNRSYTGVVGQGVYMYGAQAEPGSPTSYIPTTSSSVTRSADAASLTVPSGASTALFTFSDNSTQSVSVSPGAYTIPTNLNRPIIASLGIS